MNQRTTWFGWRASWLRLVVCGQMTVSWATRSLCRWWSIEWCGVLRSRKIQDSWSVLLRWGSVQRSTVFSLTRIVHIDLNTTFTGRVSQDCLCSEPRFVTVYMHCLFHSLISNSLIVVWSCYRLGPRDGVSVCSCYRLGPLGPRDGVSVCSCYRLGPLGPRDGVSVCSCYRLGPRDGVSVCSCYRLGPLGPPDGVSVDWCSTTYRPDARPVTQNFISLLVAWPTWHLSDMLCCEVMLPLVYICSLLDWNPVNSSTTCVSSVVLPRKAFVCCR